VKDERLCLVRMTRCRNEEERNEEERFEIERGKRKEYVS
jgi:hypothetical protein